MLAYLYESWGGIAMHAQAPDEVVELVFQALTKAVNTAPVRAFMEKTGSRMETSASPKEFAEQIGRGIQEEARLVKTLGLTAAS